MKTVSAAEANRSFSKMLGSVDKGETFMITSHGRPVAKLVPIADAGLREARDRAVKELFDDLHARPVRNLPRMTRDEIYDYLDE